MPRLDTIEFAEISSPENLSIVEKHGYLELYDSVKGFLGYFDIWHDSENENAEYFNLNNNKIYLDEIKQI